MIAFERLIVAAWTANFASAMLLFGELLLIFFGQFRSAMSNPRAGLAPQKVRYLLWV